MADLPDAFKQFDFKATVAANLLIQIVLICVFCFALDSKVLPVITLIAIAMYWLMVLMAWPRRQHLRLVERLALRLGMGALLPMAALIVFVWKQMS